MAGVGWRQQGSGIDTGTATKTILQVVAAANHALLIDEWSISFKGTSSTAAPIQVELLRQTTAGTGGVAQNPVKDPDDSDETLQVTGLKGPAGTWTAEPTAGDILDVQEVHPQTGYTWQAAFGKRIKVGGGDRLGIRVVTPGADVNCSATFKGEE